MNLKSILCVEDDVDTCELIAFALGLSGYHVETVHTYEEGLKKAKEQLYSLYSIDSRLPDGSGIELCQRIRLFDAHTPIIFYTSEAYPGEIEKAMRAGAQAYLVKPTDTDMLTRAVQTLLTDC
jgi:two-component system NtrC family response regulator